MVSAVDAGPNHAAKLEVINAQNLRHQSPDDRAKVKKAALQDGLFYLDISQDENLQTCVSNTQSLMREVFSSTLDEKKTYDVDRFDALKLNGYKPVGRNLGGVIGRRDGFESYAIAQKDLVKGTSSVPRHSAIERYVVFLQQMTTSCLSLARIIFDALTEDWPAHARTHLKSMHGLMSSAQDDLSMNILRLLRYTPDEEVVTHVPQAPHTDMGSLTFLFADTPGLQILPKGATNWQYVEPLKGMVVVNVGESLSLLSGQEFHSVLHRVASLPGCAMTERYSFAFLLRPERPAIMKSLRDNLDENATFTCEEWVTAKFRALRGQNKGKTSSSGIIG